MPRSCSSGRFRALSATPRTPVCDATTGRRGERQDVVDRRARAVGEVDDDPPALELRDELPSERRQAALLEAVRRSGDRVVEEVGEADHPEPGVVDRVEAGQIGAQRVGALDREQPGHEARIVGPAGEERLEVRAGSRRASASRPSGSPSPRAGVPGGVPAALRLRHVFAGQPRPRASSVMSSERSSLRSMFRCRGDFVATPNTWSATLPSISRGTSTWPRSPRRRRSRPQSSGSAWRSTTVAAAWTSLARSETAYGGAAAIGFSRRSVRATSVRPPARAATAPARAATAAPAATVRDPGLTWPVRGRGGGRPRRRRSGRSS